eukprot:4179479-Amphidinium_carterae.1
MRNCNEVGYAVTLRSDPRPPFLRLYSKGTWLRRPPSHHEATPHALKSTMLSWAAKFGLGADHRK